MKKTKWIGCLSLLLVATPIVSLVGLTSCNPDTPDVYKVKITAPETVVVGSEDVELKVSVDAPEDVSHDVEWTILKGSTNATLSDKGVLKPGDKAGAVSITAKSVADGSKFDTVLIQISDKPAVINDIIISGPEEIPAESEPTQFTAEVIGEGGVVSQEVVWEISAYGDTEAGIDPNGLLTPGEKTGWIQIKATSVADPSIKKTKDIEITEAESKMPEIEEITQLDSPAIYVCEAVDDWDLYGPYDYGALFAMDDIVYLINNSTVPYVNVDGYVAEWMAGIFVFQGWHNYTSETNDRKTIITNDYYLQEYGEQITCTIDYDRQKLIFNDYDKFINDTNDFNDPLASGMGGGESYYIDTTHDYHAPTNNYVIDLSKYNIKAYYDDQNDIGYLPYYVFSNILERHPKFKLFFDGEDFYTVPSAHSKWTTWETILANELYFDESLPIFNDEYMQFCYDLLALTLDVKYGLIERPSRGRPGTTIKYFEDGAYSALEPYHDQLVSLEGNASNDAIRDFFNHECDDGGHAGYSTVNLLSTSPSISGRGPETTYTSDVATLMVNGRRIEGHNLPTNAIGQIEIESSNNGENDIAWVTMDSFTSPTNDDGDPIIIDYDNVKLENYMYDTISLTMWLQKTILATPTITDVVIDLTNNGGGTVYTEHFLASYLCGGRNEYAQEPSAEQAEHIKKDKGGVTESIYNPHTKAYSQYTVWADINGDGDYTADDCLPPNVKLWCITSNCSFSCGNMLPCNLADCSDCTFIGDRTGGGACFVDNNVNMAFGNAFRGSSTFHMLKNASTPDNIISVEEGVLPEGKFYIRNTYENMTDFFDRPALIALMKS